MKNKYDWLTKEILQSDYEELGNFKLISQKHNVPRSTIERYCKIFGIKTTAKIKYDVDHNLFSTDTEASFYLAGFIAADGCILTHKCSKANCIGISLSEKDTNHLFKIKTLLNFNGPIKKIVRKLSQLNSNWNDSKQVRIDIYSKNMIHDLKRFGIGPCKSLIYEMPQWLIKHSLINHFIRGYFDGDGCFWINHESKNDRLVFSLRGTLKFLETIKYIFIEQCNLQSITVPKENGGIGQLTFKGQEDVKNIIKYLYNNSNIFLDRKFLLTKEFI